MSEIYFLLRSLIRSRSEAAVSPESDVSIIPIRLFDTAVVVRYRSCARNERYLTALVANDSMSTRAAQRRRETITLSTAANSRT